MEPLLHHGNGRIYTSRSKFRAATKALGLIEVGDQTSWQPTKDPRKEEKKAEQLEADIARAYYEVRDGMAPLTELDKARCAIINKGLQEHNYDRREYDESGKPID